MYENYYQISPRIEQFITREKPKTILEISGAKRKYGSILKSVLLSQCKRYRLDRINLNNDTDLPTDIYNNIYNSDTLQDIESLDDYDVIFIADLFENVTISFIQDVINLLLTKTNKTILAITPLYPFDTLKNDGSESKVREYHPVAFSQFDFSYFLDSTAEGQWQFYSFYPKIDYPKFDIDDVNVTNEHDRNKKLKIAYVLPHKNLTGGMKTLLEHMRQLTKRGHKVFACLKSSDSDSAVPQWSDLDPEKDVAGHIIVPPDKGFTEYIKDVDIIMVGWITQLVEFKDSKIPVVFWEQGYEALYGDYGQLIGSSDQTLEMLRSLYRIPVCMLGVSEVVIDILKSKYGRVAHLLPNGIDTNFYYPSDNKADNNTILLVGNPSLSFKGFSFALDVLQKAYDYGVRFTVDWICQRKPNGIVTNFPINYIVMPSQDELAKTFRNASILLSTSLYESFPLPPFEAMASGTAVIATDNGGIRTYAIEGENILLADQGDTESTAAALVFLLNNIEARNAIAEAGRKTVLSYSFDKIILRLEDCLYSVLNWHNGKMGGVW
jgi:glycosyltransferase involved in cell wall biosynthesis